MPNPRPPRSASSGGQSRGRPKDPEKCEAILRSAQELFTVKGLNGVSMEEVAKRAGVSKITVYSHFQSKDELFRQTVVGKCSQHWPDDLFDASETTQLRKRMRLIAEGFLNLIYSAEVINMCRLIMAQAGESSHFGTLFWETGPAPTMDKFALMLDAAHRAGELHIPNTQDAAAHFFVLLKGARHLQCLLGAALEPDAATRRDHAENVINFFLCAYASRGKGARGPVV